MRTTYEQLLRLCDGPDVVRGMRTARYLVQHAELEEERQTALRFLLLVTELRHICQLPPLLSDD